MSSPSNSEHLNPVPSPPAAKKWAEVWRQAGYLSRSVVAALVAIAAASACAQSLDPEALRRKQEDQQRARTMTRELLRGVLDLQLRQLEENGLTDLPVYRDIQRMRGNLQQVVDAEMTKVVELLTEAQRQPAAQRETTFIEARKLIRTVVVRLSAERQSLLRRLKVAELAEQVRRLMQLQSDVQQVVKSIPGESRSRQEALSLKAREDQRDVKELFFSLLETLDDVRTWGGPMATVCQDGLRILQAAGVGQHLDQVENELAAERVAAAAEHQDGVLKGLGELLRLFDKSQGMLSGELQAALDRLRALAEQQERVRSQTRRLDPNQPGPRELVEQQAAIQKDLTELARLLPSTPTADRLLEQAQTAAKDATALLFDGQHQSAVAEQGQVLGNLAALQEVLAAGAADAATDKTAAELADEVQQLKAMQEQLAQAEAKETLAAQQAAASAAAAAALERDAADLIAKADQASVAPAAVRSQLTAAEEAARSAASALEQLAGASTPQTDRLVQDAQAALDRAQATIEAALQEAERRAAAVRIGELARAAEALERAAAEERQIATEAQTLPDDASAEGLAAALAQRQAEVADIAAKLSEGLSKTAGAISQRVAEAQQQVEQSQRHLNQARQQPQMAPALGRDAARSAVAAARQLAQAAKDLRADVTETAKALAQSSRSQAEALTETRTAVEETLSDEIAALADRIERLSQAAARTADATREQQTASGRPDAAAALQLMQQIGAALEAQFLADVAADAASKTATTLPVKAITQQQAVAELIEQSRAAAKSQPEGLTRALSEARQQAQTAAKSMLDGRTANADAQRAAVLASLADALQQAGAAARDAALRPPSGPPDLNAERAAQAAADAARQLAERDAPNAARTLADAVKTAGQAAAALAAQQPQQAAVAQRQTEELLSVAQQELKSAIDQLQRAQAALLEQQSRAAHQLADRAAALEPDAMAALAEAADAAAQARDAGQSDSPQAALEQPLARSAERSLERAAATLAAREQQVRRDQAIAEALAAVTEQQQLAADQLDQLRELMEAAMATPDAPAGEPNAQAAAQAADEFAEAQRATGQGAVELSGQQQVAEPRLRQALQQAAALQSSRATQTPSTTIASNQAADAQAAQKPTQSEGADADAPGQLGQAAENAAAEESAMAPDVGFIPQSPETTAKLMAGPKLSQAMQAAQQMAQQAAANPSANARPADLPPDADARLTQNASSPSNNPTHASQQGVQPGREQQNAALKDDPSKSSEQVDPKPQAAGVRQGDADAVLRRLAEEPWFAKLPPELRKSIGAGAQQRPPRAYEERLRRYFQSVD